MWIFALYLRSMSMKMWRCSFTPIGLPENARIYTMMLWWQFDYSSMIWIGGKVNQLFGSCLFPRPKIVQNKKSWEFLRILEQFFKNFRGGEIGITDSFFELSYQYNNSFALVLAGLYGSFSPQNNFSLFAFLTTHFILKFWWNLTSHTSLAIC